MLRTHKYVIEQLTKRTMELLLRPTEVRYFIINGCSYYMVWLDDKRIAFGSGVIEIIITKEMNEQEINNLFATFIDSGYSERIAYNFWREIRTIEKLKEECSLFDMWQSE